MFDYVEDLVVENYCYVLEKLIESLRKPELNCNVIAGDPIIPILVDLCKQLSLIMSRRIIACNFVTPIQRCTLIMSGTMHVRRP